MAQEPHDAVVPRAGRRHELEARWRAILEAAARSRLTQTEYCRRRSLSASLYFWWKGEIARRDAKPDQPTTPPAERPGFLPVRLVHRGGQSVVEEHLADDGPRLEVLLGGSRRVVVRPGFDRETLRRVVETLEDSPC